jgi:hypothetical protein
LLPERKARQQFPAPGSLEGFPLALLLLHTLLLSGRGAIAQVFKVLSYNLAKLQLIMLHRSGQ